MFSRRAAVLVLALAGGFAVPAPASAQPFPERVSGSPAGGFPFGGGERLRVTPDGRHVVFVSIDPSLVPGDTNDLIDVFLRDRVTGTIERINVDSNEAQATGGASGCLCQGFQLYANAISDDGNLVVFASNATNLVPGDTNGLRDVFLRDRAAGTTIRISEGNGGPSNFEMWDVAISGDGSLAVFSSYSSTVVPGDTNNTLDLFGYAVATGMVERISLTDADQQMPIAPSPDRGAQEPSVSRDGRYVAFRTEVDLGVTDCPGQCGEIWVRDRVAGTTTQASPRTGEPGTVPGSSAQPQISGDGRFVSFQSGGILALPDTDSFSDAYIRDRQLGITEMISVASAGPRTHVGCGATDVSDDGRFVVFNCNGIFGAADTLNANDVYVRDRVLRQNVRVSVSQSLAQGTGASFLPRLSRDGRFIVFESQSSNFIPPPAAPGGGAFITFNPFLGNPPTRAVTSGMVDSRNARLTADGRYVFFETADALIAGDANGAIDVYRKELATGATIRVSVDDAGNELPGGASDYSISADGERVVFLTPDTGGFVLQGEAPTKRSAAPAGGKAALMRQIQAANTNRIGPPLVDMINVNLSGDGGTAVVVTSADGLAPGDANAMPDVFTANPDTGVIDGRLSAPSAGDSNGPSINPTLSFDGSVIAFQTTATNLATTGPADTNGVPDVMVALRNQGERKRASFGAFGQSNGPSGSPAISGDGGTVAFTSGAGNLAPSDQNQADDVFRFDVGTGSVVRVSQLPSGGDANGASGAPTISGDGSVIAWTSAATNLAPADTNGRVDVFALDIGSGRLRHAAITEGGTLANGIGARPHLSFGGQFLAFDTDATNIDIGDNTPTYDVYFGGGPTPDGLLLRAGFEGFDPAQPPPP
jgi:Tol biopolymer transport system component